MGKYEIYVGRKRESTALIGNLVKGRTDIIQGETRQADIKVGVYGIPNYSQAWGVRLVKGEVPKEPVEADNPSYTGEIKFLPWGEKGGTMIPCRYVSGYESIDQTYQTLRLKIVMKEDNIESALILLSHGHNEFDEATDKSLVRMLKIHGANENSESRHPEYEGQKFKEVRQQIKDEIQTVHIDGKFECLSIVHLASGNNDSIKSLFHIVNGKELSSVNKEDVNDIFKGLKLFADGAPDIFAKRVNDYKVGASGVIEKAKTFNILDTTKDGTLVVFDKDKKKHILLEGVDAKGNGIFDYMILNYVQKPVFDAIDKLKTFTDKL